MWNDTVYSLANFIIEKIQKLREYHQYVFKTHGITVVSYNYLILSYHNAFYRQLTGVKRDF